MLKQISRLFIQKRMAVLLGLGFSCGIPLALVGSTLQAWLTQEKIDLTVVGAFSLAGLPYTLKFLWAPLLDRFPWPFLGHRRGWILVSQLGLMASLLALAVSRPYHSVYLTAALAFCVSLAGATQDIAVDAYRAELLTQQELGPGTSIFTLGYRVAMLFSGAFALILADWIPFRVVYTAMAAAIGMGVVACFAASEPHLHRAPVLSLKEAAIAPLKEFLSRRGSSSLTGFITLYKLDVVFALALLTPFLLAIGFSKTDIGTVSKGFGFFATIAGTLLGGIWMPRLGLYKSLWTFGLLQGISGLCFYALAVLGHHYPMMVVAIAAENFFSGMGNTAYLALITSLCHPQYAATQFALLSSLMALSRVLIGAPTGWIAKQWGWQAYFLIALVLALPSLLLLLRFRRWEFPKRG